MQITLAFAALAAVAYAAPQGVTATLAPSSPAPSGFSTSYPGKFQITAVNITVASAKRDISKRAACPTATGTLLLTLDDGILKDELNRTGYIASNYQLQFDGPENGPVQDGAIYDAGFSVGSNDSLALGSSAVFYQCLSGSFYNLYSKSTGAQCNPVLINILPCGATSSGAITQSSDGQVEGTAVATAVSQLTDGQPQAQSAVPVTVSQISDGQIQAPTGVPVSQISDGQIQAPTSTAAPVSQISDGQIQAPTGVAISQISDGQIQAPTSTAAPITQISDGQIQAPTATPVSQISDGQIQAPVASTGVVPSSNGTTVASATLTQVTGSANSLTVGTGVFAAVFGVVAALL